MERKIKDVEKDFSVVVEHHTGRAFVVADKELTGWNNKPNDYTVVDEDFETREDAEAYRKEHYPHFTDKLPKKKAFDEETVKELLPKYEAMTKGGDKEKQKAQEFYRDNINKLDENNAEACKRAFNKAGIV